MAGLQNCRNARGRYTVRVSDGLNTLLARIDAAVQLGNADAITERVKQELQDAIRSHAVMLPERFCRVRSEGYARRLLHRNDDLGYTAVVMTWGPGQGTPLHDHAGIWCVECVYRGRIRVTSFSVRGGDPEQGIVQFEKEKEVLAGIGEAGALIPPFEYHMIENPDETPSYTIHVYGGEMTYCHVFEPVEGGYKRRYKELSYTG